MYIYTVLAYHKNNIDKEIMLSEFFVAPFSKERPTIRLVNDLNKYKKELGKEWFVFPKIEEV